MNLIISTITNKYYPNIKKNPAFLTCPNGNIMLYELIRNIDLINITNIFIVVYKKEINELFDIKDFKSIFNFENKTVILDIISNITNNYPETIYNCIKKYNINGPLFIKDYKSIIQCCPLPDNYLYYIDYNCDDKYNNISGLNNKSFIKYDNLNQITNISEKEIISNNICIGGYLFKNTETFVNKYEEIINIKNIDKIYISHIIYKCIIDDIIFTCKKIDIFNDFTYYEDWEKYCHKFKTLFIDIDGTLVFNSGEYSKTKWGTTRQIKNNVDFLKKIYKTGYIQIILTTARKKKYEINTIEQLKKFDIPYDNILFDLFHCKRYLINDYAETNPFPSAIAINLERNNDNLKDFFK